MLKKQRKQTKRGGWLVFKDKKSPCSQEVKASNTSSGLDDSDWSKLGEVSNSRLPDLSIIIDIRRVGEFCNFQGRFDTETFRLMMEDVRSKLLTHIGSVELQQDLDSDPIILPSLILQEIELDPLLICLDTYGNYVCQKVVTFLSTAQIYRFIESVSDDFYSISSSVPGSCVITALMHKSLEDDSCKATLLALIQSNVCQLICDSQGSHLLQLAIELCSSTEIEFIYNTTIDNFFLISTDRFGCCLIKKMIEKQPPCGQIFSLVLEYLCVLSNDQFGNYIVQYYFDLDGREAECIAIVDTLQENAEIEVMSTQKFGSNVLEKMIDKCECKRNEIIRLLTDSEDDIRNLAQNRFGNYVLQKSLELANPADKAQLYERTRNVVDTIENDLIRQKIQDRLDTEYS